MDNYQRSNPPPLKPLFERFITGTDARHIILGQELPRGALRPLGPSSIIFLTADTVFTHAGENLARLRQACGVNPLVGIPEIGPPVVAPPSTGSTGCSRTTGYPDALRPSHDAHGWQERVRAGSRPALTCLI